MTNQTGDVQLGKLRGYLATPIDAQAAVLLLPTVAGLDNFSRSRADDLAKAGLTVLAWDPYSGQSSPQNLQEALLRSQTLSDRQALGEMSQWIGFLCDKVGKTTVGVVGFCMGGRFSLLLSAREPRIASCAAVYPSLYEPRLSNQEEDAVGAAAFIGCPVMTIYPGHDHVTNADTFHGLQLNLMKRSHPTVIQFYPEARHGFLHHRGEGNESASRLAWPQIVTFLLSTR